MSAINHVVIIMMMLIIIIIIIIIIMVIITRIVKTFMDQGSEPTKSNQDMVLSLESKPRPLTVGRQVLLLLWQLSREKPSTFPIVVGDWRTKQSHNTSQTILLTLRTI